MPEPLTSVQLWRDLPLVAIIAALLFLQNRNIEKLSDKISALSEVIQKEFAGLMGFLGHWGDR